MIRTQAFILGEGWGEKMKHTLKIHEHHYYRVKEGYKTFEIRNNDRAFQMGDSVCLKLWHEELQRFSFDQKPLEFNIGCVYPIDETRVVFSLLPLIPEEDL